MPPRDTTDASPFRASWTATRPTFIWDNIEQSGSVPSRITSDEPEPRRRNVEMENGHLPRHQRADGHRPQDDKTEDGCDMSFCEGEYN